MIIAADAAMQRRGRAERILSDHGLPFHCMDRRIAWVLSWTDCITDHTVTKAGDAFTKAAVERHFGTLKGVLANAVDTVFPGDPGWQRTQTAKAVELRVALFAALYYCKGVSS